MRYAPLFALLWIVTAGSAPPCPPAPRPVFRAIDDPALGVGVYPPCVEVTWTPVDLTGQPPFTFTWAVDGFPVHHGRQWVMTTADYTGFHPVVFTATNPWGSASTSSFFIVEALSVPGLAATQNPTPGLTATVHAQSPMRGANEWRILWGDGTSTPFDCDFSDPTLQTSHTYPAPGSYTVRLQGRNCRDPIAEGPPLGLTVGDPNAIQVTEFQVQGCQSGFCVFDAGQPLPFEQSFSAPPDELRYDWHGDGIVDQITTLPIGVHTYHRGGVYRPVVTALRGANQHSLQHADFILINQTGSSLVFEDGFESGDLSCWSTAVGGGPVPPPGPSCFASFDD